MSEQGVIRVQELEAYLAQLRSQVFDLETKIIENQLRSNDLEETAADLQNKIGALETLIRDLSM